MTELNNYQEQVESLILTEGVTRIVENTLGLVGETGEIAEKIKKSFRDGTEIDCDDIAKELGDVLFYVAALASVYEIKLSDIAATNLNKLFDRKERNVLQGSGDNR